jgi:hypothetical protein
MDRGWLETVGLLGLDVQFGVVCALLAVHWAVRQARHALRRYRALRQVLGPAASRPTAPTPAGAGEPFSRDPATWPPGPWRTSH